MKKFGLLLIFITISISLKSQNVLNFNSSQIKKYTIEHHGTITDDNFFSFGTLDGPHRELFCSFPKSIAYKNDIYYMVFYLSKDDKCYKYTTTYGSDKNLKSLISNFDNPNSGLKRADNDLTWVELTKNYEIKILPGRAKRGSKTTMFMIDTHLIRTQ